MYYSYMFVCITVQLVQGDYKNTEFVTIGTNENLSTDFDLFKQLNLIT